MVFPSSLALAALALFVLVRAVPLEGRQETTLGATLGAPASPSTVTPTSATPSSLPPAKPSVVTSPSTVTSPPPVPLVINPVEIAAGLMTEPSNVNRLTKPLTGSSGGLLIGDDLRALLVFDFNNQKPAAGSKGGSILLATVDNFPILETVSISSVISIFGPCGLNIPHMHMRADEFLTVVEGQLETGFVMENGFSTEIHSQLGRYQGTIFPQGSIHYQFNPLCSSTTFFASLNSNDPGRSDIVTNFFMLEDAVVNASLGFPVTIGGDNIDTWRQFLPVNLAAGVDTCLQACGLSK